MFIELQNSLFFNIGIAIIAATIVGYVARLLKQPLIPAYILTGLLIGPFGLKLIIESKVISSLAEMGIAFLLFIVGLEINLKKLKEVGLVGTLGGVIQVALIFLAGFFSAVKLGFSQLEALYIGLILTFSSTMIVVKLLSDKNELNTLHGRIILAVLIVQDIIVIFALSLLGNMGDLAGGLIAIPLIKGLLLFAIALLSGKYILPYLFKISARNQELLFLSSMSIVFFFAWLASALGFGIAIGAFLGGLSLANLPYNFDIAGKVMSLRNFFATLFFVSLGMGLAINEFRSLLMPLLIFLGIVILLKPILLFFITIFFGYKKRTSFLTGLSLGQVSEFSLILALLGMNLGHISSSIFGVTVLITMISITLTSYFVKYDEQLYKIFSAPIGIFEGLNIVKSKEFEHFPHHPKRDIIIFGGHRMGSIFINTFHRVKDKLVVVDFDPSIIRNLIRQGIPCVYGDISNLEILKRLNIHSAKMIISTVPNEQDNTFLIRYVKRHNPRTIVIATANNGGDALNLYAIGANYVIVPHLLSGEMIARFLVELLEDKKDIEDVRLRHIRHLREMGY